MPIKYADFSSSDRIVMMGRDNGTSDEQIVQIRERTDKFVSDGYPVYFAEMMAAFEVGFKRNIIAGEFPPPDSPIFQRFSSDI